MRHQTQLHEVEPEMNDGEAGALTIATMFATEANQYIRRTGDFYSFVAAPFGPDYAFPVENRARDLRLLNWCHFYRAVATCDSTLTRGKTGNGKSVAELREWADKYFREYTFSAESGDLGLTALEEAVDRVRWDAIVAAGKATGAYEDHSAQADLDLRKASRDTIMTGVRTSKDGTKTFDPSIAETYRPLVEAKLAELRNAVLPPRDKRASKAKDQGDEVPV